MADDLFSRVKRLVSGGVNNIVDVVENATPETVMKEAISEVETAADQVRHELGEVIAAKHLAHRRLMETNTKHEDLSEKIGVAVDEGRDDLAEAAIARQLDLESQIPIIEAAIKDASARETELEQYIAALQARKREMEEELVSFRAALCASSSSVSPSGAPQGGAEAKATKAETAFKRVMGTSTGLPGMDATDSGSAVKLAELEKLSRANRVHERLAAMKARHINEGQ